MKNMKRLILTTIASALFLTSFSQTVCDLIIESTTDKMTGETTHLIKNQMLITKDGGKTGLLIDLMKSGGTIMITGKAYGASSCIGDHNNMIVLFRDSTKFMVKLDNAFNCKSKFSVFLSVLMGSKSKLEMLKSKEIESIRIETVEGYVQEDFSGQDSRMFWAVMQCLTEL